MVPVVTGIVADLIAGAVISGRISAETEAALFHCSLSVVVLFVFGLSRLELPRVLLLLSYLAVIK